MQIVLYDDDDHECFCETTPCEYEGDCTNVAVCKRAWDGVDVLEVDRSMLYRIPDDDFDYRCASYPSTREGWIYAIALTPESDLRRIKVGWTTRPIEQRIQKYRTANPTLLVLGLWDAYRRHETRILRSLDGRLGNSEVFIARDPWALVRSIRRELR